MASQTLQPAFAGARTTANSATDPLQRQASSLEKDPHRYLNYSPSCNRCIRSWRCFVQALRAPRDNHFSDFLSEPEGAVCENWSCSDDRRSCEDSYQRNHQGHTLGYDQFYNYEYGGRLVVEEAYGMHRCDGCATDDSIVSA